MSGEEWFAPESNKGISQVFKNSWVEAFVDADEYYTDLRKEVEQTGSGDIICWIGFEASGKTPMPAQPNNEAEKSCPPRPADPNDKTWLDLLTEADKRSVNIRALLNLHPSPKPPDRYKGSNFNLVADLNQLNHCNAINDFRYLFLNGTHHQKLVLVYNAKKGLMAYPGTCDVETGRINMKWCEVHCKIMGDAAVELYNLFHKRYKEHTEIFARMRDPHKQYLKPSDELKATAPQSGNFLVQVGTTYGNPNRNNPFHPLLPKFSCPYKQVVNGPHRVEISTGNLFLSPAVWTMIGNDFFMEKEKAAKQLIEEGMKQNYTYAFAKDGHTGIYYMIKKALETTKKFIYMEDQYLVNDDKMGSSMESMLTLLENKVKEDQFKKLILFTTRIDDINNEFLGTGWKHRNNFITKLVSAAPSKVEVCQYKTRGNVGCGGDSWHSIFYIHSKTWIFDDELLITGSANCNRRGYSHDSESNVAVYDQNKFFVKELRKRIWKKRLNVKGISRTPLNDHDVDDFLSACKFWARPDDYGMAIENSKQTNFQPSKYPDLNATQLADKIVNDKSNPISSNDPEKSFIKSFIERQKMDALWNLIVDPDGA